MSKCQIKIKSKPLIKITGKDTFEKLEDFLNAILDSPLNGKEVKLTDIKGNILIGIPSFGLDRVFTNRNSILFENLKDIEETAVPQAIEDIIPATPETGKEEIVEKKEKPSKSKKKAREFAEDVVDIPAVTESIKPESIPVESTPIEETQESEVLEDVVIEETAVKFDINSTATFDTEMKASEFKESKLNRGNRKLLNLVEQDTKAYKYVLVKDNDAFVGEPGVEKTGQVLILVPADAVITDLNSVIKNAVRIPGDKGIYPFSFEGKLGEDYSDSSFVNRMSGTHHPIRLEKGYTDECCK